MTATIAPHPDTTANAGASQTTLLVGRQWRPFVEVPIRLTVDIVRQVRPTKCVNCRLRRVLYRVVIQGNVGDDDATEARCAECWGITKEGSDG